MKGLNLKAVKALESLINSKFDKISLDFLGLIPKVSREKKIIFTTNRNSLTSLFLQALGTRDLNKTEESSLKVLLRIANGYVEALKERTTANILHRIDGYLKDNKYNPKSNKIYKIYEEEMDKSKKHFKMIASTESNKAKNVGTALQITRVAESEGIDDPTVFFIVTKDEVTCDECKKLHLLDDNITPRVWKLSELGHEYHKKGDWNSKVQGLHPNCFVGNKGVNILTEHNGYMNIKDIRIGDRVLTHTGKFKKVLNTLQWYEKKYRGKFIKIKYKMYYRDEERISTLKVTPEHQFLTQRGWVEAKDLQKTDKLQHLKTTCRTCGKKTPVKPKRNFKNGLEGYFCSKQCKAKYQWTLPYHRENISQKSSKLNVNIEYDGGGHYLPVYTKKMDMESFLAKQEGRDNYLQKCGYHVIRYSEIPSIDRIKEDVFRVSNNYTSNYFFEDHNIINIEYCNNKDRGEYKLYDLTIEDDESFVVNGIVSHNCRCYLTYLSPGWGFNEKGNVTYKGKGWDEYKHQREKYGLPRDKKLNKAYKDTYGRWRFDPSDEHGMEHPDNKDLPNTLHHQVAHKTNSGKMVWTPKYLQWNNQVVEPKHLDQLHRDSWKKYTKDKGIDRGSDFRNTMVKLNKQIINDNDRHLRVSGTSGHSNPKHTELRQRHLLYAYGQKHPGYSIEEVKHPESGQHLGVRIKAPRHKKDGSLYETSWFYDGNELTTEYDKDTGKKFK